jgi:hypothetical protein
MKRLAWYLLPAMMLAACSDAPQGEGNALAPPPDLETAAIERGLIRDPDDTDLTGLYARDTDRLCVVPADGAYRVGAFVDYGDNITCSARGKATRVGETMHIELGSGGGCSFDARFDGERIVFPGRVPDGCQALCSRRASFAALEVARLSESEAEASALRDPKGRSLCRD